MRSCVVSDIVGWIGICCVVVPNDTLISCARSYAEYVIGRKLPVGGIPNGDQQIAYAVVGKGSVKIDGEPSRLVRRKGARPHEVILGQRFLFVVDKHTARHVFHINLNTRYAERVSVSIVIKAYGIYGAFSSYLIRRKNLLRHGVIIHRAERIIVTGIRIIT